MRIVVALFLVALLAACAHLPPTHQAVAPLILISVDGLRPGDVNDTQMPRLTRFGREGVRARMRPSYPSLTFPNHYTLVTGLRPDVHGIVHNQMRDAALGEFQVKDGNAVGNPAWWGGEPLWVAVIRAGAQADTLFWPGSEAPIQGVRPRRWLRYDDTLSPRAQVERLLSWIRDKRAPVARLSTMYFSQVDKASHDHGPDSPEARAARGEVDAAIGTLMDALAADGLAVNLVVVSDHGFETVPIGQQISTSDLLPTTLATPISEGQVIGFVPRQGQTDQVRKAIGKPLPHATCFTKDSLPERWHYGRNPRIPPIVCQMQPGWDALYPASLAKARTHPASTRGSHGYDPDLPAMRALFIARGPAFPAGVTLADFDNVDVYGLLRRLVALPPARSDGNPHRFDDLLDAGRHARH